jgi:P22_AR N-terminal domain
MDTNRVINPPIVSLVDTIAAQCYNSVAFEYTACAKWGHMSANEPVERQITTFFEHPCLIIRLRDGTIYVSFHDLCDAVGLNRRAQIRRLKADPDLRDGVREFRAPTAGGMQEIPFLILEFVPTWITNVDRSRASVVVQERLRFLRLFIVREVYATITRAAGLPQQSSRDIEDLNDLQRFDAAMQGLAEQQQALIQSQDRARQAWKDHENRLRQIEALLGSTEVLSNGQRGQIHQLVQRWAQARIEREGVSSATAFSAIWATIKTRYNVAKYEHIPARQYADCVTFIKHNYEQLTGMPLEDPLDEEADGSTE